MVDMVVPRKQLHDTLSRILDLLLNKTGKGRALKPNGFLDLGGIGGKKAGSESGGGKTRAALTSAVPKKVANTNSTTTRPARKKAANG
jgi:acetyl-CoA carboxylase carboxyl transferase subunit beta